MGITQHGGIVSPQTNPPWGRAAARPDAETDDERKARRAELLAQIGAPAHSWLHTASLQTVEELVERNSAASTAADPDE